MRAVTCVAFLTAELCGCRSESSEPDRKYTAEQDASNEPDRKYTAEQDAALIGVARNAALAQGWTLEDCIYSVRPDGSGWIVQVDRAPGYQGKGEPSVVVDATFFVHINADGRAVRLLSFSEDVELPRLDPESHHQ